MTEVLTYEALKADRDAQQKRADALAVENAGLKEIIHPIANQNTDVECTDRPVWYVCDPRQMMSPTASALCHMFHGPFWSRERAEEFLENTSYRYGNKASVFCKSLYHYPEMRKLFDASKNLATAATDAALAAIEARGVEKFVTKVAERLRTAGGEDGYSLVNWGEYADHLEAKSEEFAIELREAK